MNTYEIKNIQPGVDAANRIIGVSLDLYATDETGDVAEMSWRKTYDVPLATLDTFADADLLALCETVAADNDMHGRLDTILINRKQPDAQGIDPNYVPVKVPLTDTQTRTLWMRQIDDSIAFYYDKFQRFSMEYTSREAAALAYKTAGYTGDPTVWITRFADNTGITYQQCTDVILSQASKLRAALLALGEQRMDKYKILSAASLDAAQVAFDAILAQCLVIDASL